MSDVILETPRLILRQWRRQDRPAIAALNGDAEVMRYFPARMSRAESDAFVDRQEARFAAEGLCFAPVERKSDGAFLGAVGLAWVLFDVPFAPAVEIGWRFAASFWGHGYASEAAKAWLTYGFDVHDCKQIVSFTATINAPSRRVMERIGMERDEDGDFDHPRLDAASPLRPHVLYRIRRPGPTA